MAEEKSSTGYNCYSDASSSGNHLVTGHFQTFEPPTSEIYHMTPQILWKGGFGNHPHDGGGGDPSSSMEPTSSDFYHQHDFNKKHDLSLISNDHQTLMASSLYQNQSRYDDLFTCHERPSKGLSLSLSSSNPSTIALQSFELRQQQVNIHHQQGHIRNSRYLIPTQELLNEFCSIGTKQIDANKTKAAQKLNCDDENALRKQPLFSLDLLDLQRRKTKLLHMLEEVDKRYRHYCDQMKAVTSSFEWVAGEGAARVYSALASQAMSRHFRCLRDGIVAQIKATKKAMGDRDISVPGTVKGETPRLRVLDQTLRQQKALQQMSLMESHPWRPQRGLPERSVSVLRAWLFEHFLHPYPSDVDKHILARQTGLSRSQVSNWFINARVRLWKPMVEEMYIEELKEDDAVLQNQNLPINEDQKPTHDQLVRIDSDCLSSIINNPDKNEPFGAMELDFGGGGSVSLTLGLHQNGGGGFATAAMFEDCQTVPYSSLLDNENQTLPYRNLMGAQLLHDLAG